MSLRNKLQSMPPLYAGLGAGLCILVALVAIYWVVRPKPVPGFEKPVVLKCIKPTCGAVEHTTYADVAARPNGPSPETDPGIFCKTCGGATMAFAAECPNDHTVFIRIPYRYQPTSGPDVPKRSTLTQGRSYVCPTCGWDPAQEAIDRMKSVAGK